MKVISFLLTSSAVVALAMGGGGVTRQAVAQTEAPTGAEAGSASVEQARLRVEEARVDLEQAQADGGDVAAAEAELAEAEAGLAAAEETAATVTTPAEEIEGEAEPTAEASGTGGAAHDAPVATEAEELTAPADQPADASVEPVVPAAEETTAEPAAPEATAAPPQEDPVTVEPTTEPKAPAETAAPTLEPTEAEPLPAEPAAEGQAPAQEAPAKSQPTEGEQPSPEAASPAAPTEPGSPVAQEETDGPAAEPQTAAPAAEPDAAAPTSQPGTEAPIAPAQAEKLSPQDLQDAQRASGEEAVQAAEAEEADKSEEERDSDRADRLRILGAAAAGAAIGALIPELGGRLVGQQGDRVIIQQGDAFVVRKDETERLLTDGSTASVEELVEGRTQVTVTRPDGTQIITLRDAGGNLLRRVRRLPNGDEVLLFAETQTTRADAADLATLPSIPLDERRIVYLTRASEQEIERALLEAPIAPAARAYSLREVRDTYRLRWQMPSIRLDVLTFETKSAELGADQLNALDAMGATLAAIVARRPDEVFLIEGHTDAVGGDLHNLALSDRRAETVAALLTRFYDVPPENVIAQGYGEQDLTVPTMGPSRENRRVEMRRITPLLRQ